METINEEELQEEMVEESDEEGVEEEEGAEEEEGVEEEEEIKEEDVDSDHYSPEESTQQQSGSQQNDANEEGNRDQKKRKVQYDEKNIEEAVNWLSMNGGTVSDAAKRFNIPRSTLRFRLKSTDPVGQRKSGAPPALSPEEEQMVVDWVRETARIGQPLSWKRLSIAVKEMLDRSGHTKVFANNNMPSSGWLRAFKKRHPHLSPAKSEDVTVPDTLTKEDIKKWFVELQIHLKEEGLDPETFLQPNNGNRIFSSEEVVVMLQGEDRLSKVLTQKGKRNVPKFCSPGRKMITVMTCISASGSYLRPFIVFEGRKIPLQQLQQQVDPTSFDVGFSKRGGIDHELFGVWIEGLVNYLDHHEIQRPVLLLLDSNTCHIDLNTCEMAKDNGVIMHLLPPHANQLMQPVDVGIFKTLKTAYRDSVDHYTPSHGPAINKKHFPLVFVNAWKSASIKDNATNGFKEAGLVPLNMDMIDTSKIQPKAKSVNSGMSKDRAPGRPLFKGSKGIKKMYKPPGNEYIRGLSDALDHIIHNYVSEKIRPIYQKWILEEKSCTPDPVFYIWGSLKTLIEENTKKQCKYEENYLGIRHSNAVQPIPKVSKDESSSSVTATTTQYQINNKITTCNLLTQQISTPKTQEQCLYQNQQVVNQVQTLQQPTSHLLTSSVSSAVYTPQSMAMSHVVTPLVPWEHNLQASQSFNRYFTAQQQHQQSQNHLQGIIHPTTMTLVSAPPNSAVMAHLPQPGNSAHLQPSGNLVGVAPTATAATSIMMAHPQTNIYYTSGKELGKTNSSTIEAGVKRQWMEEKNTSEEMNKRQLIENNEEKDERNEEDGCNVYDGTDSSSYSARIGLCMQEVQQHNICQLQQYQEQ